MTNYGFQVLLARYQEPGFYNDPDFLIMDWPWLSLDEKKSQFALWASFSAPLIISAYVPDLSADVVKLLTNEDIIKVDQDPLGLQATLVSQDGTWDVLTKTLVGEGRLLTVLNRGNVSGSISVNVDRIGLKSDKSYTAKDLWTGAQIEVKDAIKITLQPHATAIYRFSGVSSATPTGMIFNTASLSCLTASNASLIFANCTSADSQVWQITEDGHISPLSASTMCMGGRETGVELQICNKGVTNQQWIYQISGNLVNKATKLCLTERLGVGSCGDELDSQVFGLPSGVEAIRESGSRGL
jgi:alpha-galactosidase